MDYGILNKRPKIAVNKMNREEWIKKLEFNHHLYLGITLTDRECKELVDLLKKDQK